MRIREHMAWNCRTEFFGGPGKVVEVDETLLRSVRGPKGVSTVRTVIFGITDRKSVFTTVLEGRKKKRIYDVIKHHIAPGTIIMTDGWLGYRDLAKHGYEHKFVNHRIAEWINAEGTSTLYIDAYWAYLKRFIRGTHLHIGQDFVENYIKESEFRFNYRRRPQDMLMVLLKNHPPLLPYSGKVRVPQRRSKAGGNMGGEMQLVPETLSYHLS